MGGKGSGNRSGSSNKAKFDSPETLQAAIDAYFDRCDKTGMLYDEAGLCLALGISKMTLQSWYDGTRSTEMQAPIQNACLRIEHQLMVSPVYQEKGMVTKAIFMLKQKRLGGYQDRVESQQDISVNVKMGKGMDESDFK